MSTVAERKILNEPCSYRGAHVTESGVYTVAAVRHVVSWPAVNVKPEATVYAGLGLFDTHQFHHLLVAKHGALLGILCRCDLLDAPMRGSVGDHMTRNVVWLLSDATLVRAKSLMDSNGVNALPVSDSGTWGIITRGDLVRAGVGDRPTCTACGATHHLRPHRLYEDEMLCRECRTPIGGELARSYLDLGVAG